MLNRSFGLGKVPEQLADELWCYSQGISQKFNNLRTIFNLSLPDTLSKTDTAVIAATAENSVDVFIDEGREIFKEMLRKIILLRLALYKSKRSL